MNKSEYQEGLETPVLHSRDAERSVLSSIFQQSKVYLLKAQESGITAKSFYSQHHGKLFDIFIELDREDKPVEPVTLTQKLDDQNQLLNMGGRTELFDIFAYAPTHAHFDHHVELIKREQFKRSTLDHARELTALCYESEEVESIISKLSTETTTLLEQAVSNKEKETMMDSLKSYMQEVEDFQRGDEDPKLKTLIEPIDDHFRGGIIKKGNMLITALPSTGKTATALQITSGLNAQGKRVLWFSNEMDRKSLYHQYVPHVGGMDSMKTKEGQALTKYELNKFKDGMTKVQKYVKDKLYEVVEHCTAIDKLCAIAEIKNRDQKIDCIIIDYFQLMEGRRGAQDNMETYYKYVEKKLKQLANKTESLVITLSQENDEGTAKYCKALNESSDLVLSLSRYPSDKNGKSTAPEGKENNINGIYVLKDKYLGRRQTFIECEWNLPLQKLQKIENYATYNES